MKTYFKMIGLMLGFWLSAHSVLATELDAVTYATKEGNMLHWSKKSVDSVSVLDPTTGDEFIYITINEPYIYKIDQDSTYFINQLTSKPLLNHSKYPSFEAYFTDQLIKIAPNKPSLISAIGIKSMIIDKQGKIVYHEFSFAQNGQEIDMEVLKTQYPKELGALLYELNYIMYKAPKFLPGKMNNKNVPTLYSLIAPIGFRNWMTSPEK